MKAHSPDSLGWSEDGASGGGPLRTLRPKTEALWRSHDAKAQKSGQRGTIYWVGKSIIGEDNQAAPTKGKGQSYNGEWDNNKKQGYGVQSFPNGQKYEGQWGNGLRNGEGTLWVPIGKAQKLRKLYVGGWADDKRHGRGTCFFKNGEYFQGSWDHGEMHGQGTFRYGNGDLYIGDWYNGLRSGHGTLNKANGDCYEGYWLNDKREGSGSFFYAESGKVFVGEWANDLPKAGVYTQSNPNPDQAVQVPTTSTLPPVRLAMPAEVLDGALGAVRNARKSYRAKITPLNRLFADDEVIALQDAFDTVRRGDGTIGPSQLQNLCTHLGTEVSMPRLRRLLADVGLLPASGVDVSESEMDVSILFEDFLRVVALVLEEEATANPDMSQADMPFDSAADYWDDNNFQQGYGDEDIDGNMMYRDEL